MTKNLTDNLLHFLDASPTAWHAVTQSIQQLEKAGYKQLKEEEEWDLKPGNRYYVKRRGSTLCAFIVPSKSLEDACILAAHTDSPALKLKPKAEFRKENLIMLALEPYGSPIYASWVNRNLGIAGQVAYEERKKIKEILVDFKTPVFIPQLPIHIDRQVNEKGLFLNPQEHLCAVASLTKETEDKKSYIETLFQQQLGSVEVLSTDLFLYPLEKASLFGSRGELVSSARLDNLASVHAILSAMTAATKAKTNTLNLAVFWDHEEIGSQTALGAHSPFLLHLLERICLSLKKGRDAFLKLLSTSFCLSLDVAHAYNPNFPEKFDPRHQNLLGNGVTLKVNANQKYVSDTQLTARLRLLCKEKKIGVQVYSHRSDIPSGSTVGPINAARTGIQTIDIGIPLLSMHSACEAIATKDHTEIHKLLESILI